MAETTPPAITTSDGRLDELDNEASSHEMSDLARRIWNVPGFVRGLFEYWYEQPLRSASLKSAWRLLSGGESGISYNDHGQTHAACIWCPRLGKFLTQSQDPELKQIASYGALYPRDKALRSLP